MDRLEAMELAKESDHCLRPAEAFSRVGNEDRVAILEALWQADDQPVAFMELKDAAGTDNSAKFNYHLGELAGHFVRKTDGGYELRTAGERVVQAVVEGSFNAHPTLDPIDTGDECTECRGSLLARYADETFTIECSACRRTHGQYSFPPGGLIGRDETEILEAFDRRVQHQHQLARDSVCPECSGQMRTDIVRGDDCCLTTELRVEYVCLQCHYELCSPIGFALLDHPEVVSFYREQGVDLQTTPYWRLDWCVSDDRTTVASTDPWRIVIPISLAGETLGIALDGDLSVLETWSPPADRVEPT
jgi:hypothetical protein